MAIIQFHYPYKGLPFRQVKAIKQAIKDLFAAEGRALMRLDYIFCSDEYLLELNKGFLNHDYFTDIVTFDLSESADNILGELYISLDRVKDNSKEIGVPYSTELLRVIFHGALHLCGYKDKTKREISLMRSKEDHYLHLFAAK